MSEEFQENNLENLIEILSKLYNSISNKSVKSNVKELQVLINKLCETNVDNTKKQVAIERIYEKFSYIDKIILENKNKITVDIEKSINKVVLLYIEYLEKVLNKIAKEKSEIENDAFLSFRDRKDIILTRQKSGVNIEAIEKEVFTNIKNHQKLERRLADFEQKNLERNKDVSKEK